MRTLERVMHAAIASSVWHVSIFYMAHLQATIAKSLGSIELMPWLSIGFFVGALIAIMPLCHVYARRSVKFIFLGSIVSGLGATTLCSTANSMLTAILACVWAGSSASGSLLGAFYTNVLVAPRHNNISRLSHLQVAWGFGIIIGPLMAAAVRPEAWRTALYIHIILGIPIFISLACLVPSSRPMPLDRQDVLPFDFLGLILSAACVVLFTLATNWASVAYSFASWQVIVLYWLSGVCLIAFFYQQANCIGIRLHARLLPELPWATKQFYVLWALVALSAIVAYVPLFYLAVYLQLVRGQSQFYSSLVSLAFNLSQGLGGTVGGVAALEGSDCKFWIWIGAAASLVSAAILSKIELNTGLDAITTCLIMLGVGSGSLLKALEMATFTRPAFSFERFATYKTMMFAQMFGLVLGLSLAGGLFIHEAKSQLTQRFRFMDHVDIVQLLQGASSSYAVRLVGADGMPAVLECLLAGIKHVLVLVYGAAGMALLVALICAKCLTEEALADGP